MRSHNGWEYASKEFKDLILQHHIKHEFTSPYSTRQNGVAERNWRTLFDMARSLLIESGMPKDLWTYALLTATYIRNRCFNRRFKGTAYGTITGLKPDVSRLHVFGTICYAYIHTHTKKLDARSKRGFFVGYDRESASYLVYYLPRIKICTWIGEIYWKIWS